jgi:hypothetical protein
VTKTSQSQPLHLHSLQPWLRDHYAALRAEAGPRLEHTRAVVVPVLVDTSHRVRQDLVPAAGKLSSRVAGEAKQRSAPLRAEMSDRAAATLAAARGGVTAKQIEHLQHRHGHRKLWFIGGAVAAGAALGTAAVLWQRSRYHDWVEDDAVHSMLDAEDAKDAETGHPNPERLNSARSNGTADHDDPADPDGGAQTDASSAGRRAKH